MASIFRKIVTRPLPAGAAVTRTKNKSTARWIGRDGKTRTAGAFERDGSWFVREESSTWYARYRDGDNVLVEAATGCQDMGPHVRH
jgi:hypothetical protein